jgi:hypothetical protein
MPDRERLSPMVDNRPYRQRELRLKKTRLQHCALGRMLLRLVVAHLAPVWIAARSPQRFLPGAAPGAIPRASARCCSSIGLSSMAFWWALSKRRFAMPLLLARRHISSQDLSWSAYNALRTVFECHPWHRSLR